MTADLRNRIRAAIDARQRERLTHPPARRYCARCGCDTNTHTTGCKTCSDRHRGRAKRLATA